MTREAIHSGEFLADELEEIGMKRTELARQIDVPATASRSLFAGDAT
jgi:plasmid maintenance system antidote protein VapI